MYFRNLTEGFIILIFKEAELEELLEDSLKIVDKKDFLERQEYLQVYYDYGKGFDESKSLKYDYNYKNEIKLEIPIKEGIKSLRIDPKNKALNLKIKNSTFRGIDGNEQEIDFESNAIYNDKKYYIFTTEDPQIYFKDLSEGLLVLKFKEVELGEMLENAIKITDKTEILDKEEYLQIYYDYGDGFSEENSSKYEYNYLEEIEERAENSESEISDLEEELEETEDEKERNDILEDIEYEKENLEDLKRILLNYHKLQY